MQITNKFGHKSEWIKSDYFCLNCSKNEVWYCKDEDEDNAGYAHLCIACGYGFYHPGESYAVHNAIEVVEQIKNASR